VWARPVCFVNARVVAADGPAASLRFSSRVLAIDSPPRKGDTVVDVDGAFVLPGLVNAHDHLELNHYGQLKGRERYENASAWIEDMRPRLREDAAIRAGSAQPLASRLFIGGLKNLLAGVTTVAHHNPLYREIRRHVPVRVVRRYGWAHSFFLERQPVGARGEPGGEIRARCSATPRRVPFIVHAAEGIDDRAATELDRIETLGCLRGNTVLVHGVALGSGEWLRIIDAAASLVWCPASNQFLFGRTLPIRQFLDASDRAPRHVCLGTDSRVTGARDLLDELRVAAAAARIAPRELLNMVTRAPADILRLPDAGRLAPGVPADLLVIPAKRSDAADALLGTMRQDVELVTVGGMPMIGGPSFRSIFEARHSRSRSILVDGRERLASSAIAKAIARCPIREPGVECLS
jgi:cytosine/adenosine deaminase-related metal-dependent hydrolase